MELDYKALGFWLQFIQVAATVLVFLYVWITNRQKVNSDAIEKMREQFSAEVNEIDDRLIRVEQDIKHLPTHEDVSDLRTSIGTTNQNLTELRGTINQINNTVSLMHSYLLNGGTR